MFLPRAKGSTTRTLSITPAHHSRTRMLGIVVTRARFFPLLAVAVTLTLLWSLVPDGASSLSGCRSRGPSKSPLDMTPGERASWEAHLQTPVIFNHHAPIEVKDASIQMVDLNTVRSTTDAVAREEKVLVLTPLRNAAHYMDNYFDLLSKLTYPHHLIDLAFLVGDTDDDSLAILTKAIERAQGVRAGKSAFRSVLVVQKDFGITLGMDVQDRHSFAAQASRRKAMARARNYLLSAALKTDHSWVYWRDVDIKDSPARVLEDFIKHDRDVLVPNVWFHRYEEHDGELVEIEGRFDYNSWQESEQALALAARLPKDTIIFEGYKEYNTSRNYMCLMGGSDNDRKQQRGDRHAEIPLDGIGGVNIVVKADVHRSGINFPAYAFENQAETEGFAKMARRAGYGVYGLPNYLVWHVDTLEKPGNSLAG